MRSYLIVVAILCALATATRADGLGDAQAGLTALNGGDNDEAIRLLSHAIQSGELRGDDLEFGYACRGRAYLHKGDNSHAIADLDRARQMKPDDSDAEGDINTALAAELPADQIPGAPKPSLLGAIAGMFIKDLADALQNPQQ